MRRLLDILQQPHPANDDLRIYFRTIIAIAFMVLFTLFVMRPFGLSEIRNDGGIFFRALTYTGTGFIMMLINSLWIIFLPQLFRQEKWTVGKESLFVLYQWLTISTTIWLVNSWLHRNEENIVISSWTKSILLAGASGMLPYLLVMTSRYFYLLRQNLRSVEKLNRAITSTKTGDPFPENRTYPFIKSDDPKIPPLHADEFLFLESKGNYLHLFCEKKGITTKYRLRSTVKEFRETNRHIPSLFQCHRAYLINISRILHIEGNAAGYLLEMHPLTKKIPVSRSRISEFKKILRTTKMFREKPVSMS